MKRLRDFIYEALKDKALEHIEVTPESVAKEMNIELGDINKVIKYLKDNEMTDSDIDEQVVKDADVDIANDEDGNKIKNYIEYVIKAVLKLLNSDYFKSDKDKDDEEKETNGNEEEALNGDEGEEEETSQEEIDNEEQ